MREDIKDRWIERLTVSPQGTRSLRPTIDTFDCWGHLCDIAITWGMGEWDTEHRYVLNGKPHRYYPPFLLLEWAEIDPRAVPDHDIRYYLANVNDNGSNFGFITTEIRTYL